MQGQKNKLQIWALVDTDDPLEKRRFFLAQTGDKIPEDIRRLLKYISTVKLLKGIYVCHLFEITEEEKVTK